MKLIVCLTGMPGAGKSTVAHSADKLGFSMVSLGGAVRDETTRRGLVPNDANLGFVMLKLREEGGPGAVAELALPMVLSCESENILIDGIRSIYEVEVFRKVATVKLLALHASPKTRYYHLHDRGRKDAPLTWEDFQARDKRELSVGVGEAIALSDEVISNNEITINDLQKRTFTIIRKWLVEIEN